MREDRGWRITGVGRVVIGLLVLCALLITFTSGSVRFVAAVVTGGVLLLLASDGLSGRGGTAGKAEALRSGRYARRRP
jgi:hypothetical protein